MATKLKSGVAKQAKALLFRKHKFGKIFKRAAFAWLAAAFLWFFSSLNQEYAIELNLETKFLLQYNNLVVNSELPTSLRAKVYGLGWDLMQFYLTKKNKTYSINISDHLNKPFWESYLAIPILQQQFPANISILEIEKFKQRLQIDTLSKIKLPLKPEFNFNFTSNLGLLGPIKLIPDSVWVSFKSKTKNLPEHIIVTSNYKPDFDNSFFGYLPILNPDNQNLFLEFDSVFCQIKVGKIAKGSFTFDLPLTHSDNQNIAFFPSQVQFSFTAEESSFNNILPDLIAIEYITDTTNQTATLKLKTNIDGLIEYRFFPSVVDFIYLP